MSVRFTSVLLLAATVAYATVEPASHSHTDGKRLSSRWYHEEDHPVHKLFRRAGSNDGVTYPAIGTAGMLCVELLLSSINAPIGQNGLRASPPTSPRPRTCPRHGSTR